MLEQPWPDTQSRLVEGLRQAAAYGRVPEGVVHIQTHISHVFIAGAFAFKIKKPLDLGFLDFSSLAKRRTACEDELRVNRRLAPALYLAVVPITGSESAPSMDGKGEAIEYAVKMQAFRQQDLLDAVLGRGALTSKMIDDISQRLACFHLALDPAALASGHGSGQGIQRDAEQNFEQLMPLIQDDDPTAALQWLREWTRIQGQQLHAVFEARRRAGYVRECHGDLHLGNIALHNSEVQMFDAIEFSEPLRWVDVMSEVAFLAMDLAYRQRADLAFRFLNQYLERTGDYDGVETLRFYMVYRALVRAKVLALRATQPDVQNRQRGALKADCVGHVQWALDWAKARHPLLVILHGFSGSGKTSRSLGLAERMGALRLRSDVERKRVHGIHPLAHPQHQIGQGLYDATAGEATYARLEALVQPVLRAGYPVIVDAAFLLRAQRARFSALAGRLHVAFAIVHFSASVAALRARVAARTALGADASDANLDVLDHQLIHAEPLSDEESSHVMTFDTEHMSMHDLREHARRLLSLARR